MVCSSTIRNCVPPRLAMSLLEVVLPPQSANNVIGDLVEEFCVRVHRDGLRDSQRWFWLQALRTSRISIREGWIVQRVVGEAKRWRLVAFSLAVFALSMFYYFSLSTSVDKELQIQVASNNFELSVLPLTPSRSNASQTYKNNRLKTDRKFSAASYLISTDREKSKDDKRSLRTYPNVVPNADGTLRPSDGYRWVHPEDARNFDVQIMPGLIKTVDGLRPDKGYSWVNPTDPPLIVEVAKETAGPAPPTSALSTSSGTIYPFHEPGMSTKGDSPQPVSVSSTQERGCFR